MDSLNLKIEKASIFDMNEIVKMAFTYHKEDPKSQEILSNPVKSFFFRMFGPLYVWLKFESFKAVVSGRMAGYILLKRRKSSIHIWDIVVRSEFSGKGIGTSLMKLAEKIAENKCQYLTLAVMENNTDALRLYQKLKYRNLRFSPVCFRVEELPTRMRGWNTIKLESISGEKALLCRKTHYYDVVEAASGFVGRKMVQLLYPPPAKLQDGVDYFEIITHNKEAGYVSIKYKEDLTSIFLTLNPDFWGTNTEVEIIDTIIDRVSKATRGKIEIWVMQAYEKSLQSSFKKMGLRSDRIVPRLVLVKKLE